MGGCKMTALATKLESIVGPEHVRTGEAAGRFAVDGVRPEVAVFPGSVEEVSAVLAACSEARVGVIPWGGGTSMGQGAIPARGEVALGLTRLDRVLEHEPADMTSTVQAGMTLAAYQAALGERGQFLALDAPSSGRATIGGILAANVSGPRRIRYGTARDLLIGAKIVHADGTVTRSGAKVVKNVTGYDLNKLYVGSLGTLGVIVEACFRLYPHPTAERTWIGWLPDAARGRDAVAALLDSPLVPSALELLNRAAAEGVLSQAGISPKAGSMLLAVAVASVPEAVAAQLGEVARLARPHGGEGEVVAGEAHERFWQAVRDVGANGEAGITLKASVLPGHVGEAFGRGEAIAAQHGLRVASVSEAGTGVVRYRLWDGAGGGEPQRRMVEAVLALRAMAGGVRGSLVVLDAPPEVKAAADVWGPVGQGLALMRALKEQFDPSHTLNPGRFVGGL
jgi:glycolate oxidase FAD binding subunit